MGLTSPRSSQGLGRGEVMRLSSVMRPRQEGGVMADPGLAAWPGLFVLAGPQLFGPSLADVLRAAWPANLIGALGHPQGYNPNT